MAFFFYNNNIVSSLISIYIYVSLFLFLSIFVNKVLMDMGNHTTLRNCGSN